MTALMIQGTGSNVGKSLLVAGLCRAARRRGLSVAPFKPQNMSNNAAVTADGGEIGRAQALQARACGLEPVTDMNPVLLKPETDRGSQVVVQGRAIGRAEARDYQALKPRLMGAVLDSFARLGAAHELVIVEGAGSPAEVNLRPRDIANMGFARAAGVPVVLAGDIDRGGVIAQIVGTQAVMAPEDAAMVRGFLINKFRGDPRLFDEGYRLIAARTGWPGLGVLPWFPQAHRLPAEDAADLQGAGGRFNGGGFGEIRLDGTRSATGTGAGAGAETGAGASRPLHVVCLTLSRIANFDDLDPLAAEPGVRLSMLAPGRAIPGDADLVILPGTKSTLGDLAFLRAQGWDIDLLAHRRRGGHVLGLCGGYQMLGRTIADPTGADGPATAPGMPDATDATTGGAVAALGLLDVATVMSPDKRLERVAGTAFGQTVSGYEIHMGRTRGPDCARPFAHVPGPDGALSPDGRVMGSYLHGLFSDDAFRAAFLARLGAPSQGGYDAGVEAALDALADHVEAHLDVPALLALAR